MKAHKEVPQYTIIEYDEELIMKIVQYRAAKTYEDA
jgi:hypothetical protein